MISEKRLIRLTQKILGFNSENPPGNELALSRFIEGDMRSLGLHVKTKSFAKERPNVIATLQGKLPRARAQKHSILITPHFDTVPIGKGWTKSPYGKDIIADKIYGRGASDDKGNAAVCMEVMRSLVENGLALNHDLIMAATVDEETGSQKGIVPLLEEGILKPGYALILDSDECHAIVAQKGLVHCRVQIFGKRAHGAYNWRGVNAIEIAAQIIAEIKAMKTAHKKHSLLRGPTINIGTIRGGDKVNMVADFCEFSVDLRFLPGMSHKNILQRLRAVVASHAKQFKIEIDDMQYPYEISSQHPFVKNYMDELKAMRISAGLRGSEGATVMTFFQKHKIPAFATGFGASGTAHTTDEYARCSTLVKGAKLLERFLIRFDNYLAEGRS